MARYTGPKHRLARREGVNILDKRHKVLTEGLIFRLVFMERKERKDYQNMGFSLEKNRKQSLHMVFWKNSLRT